MHGIDIILPGGLFENGRIERHARFRPLTGRIEQTLIESELSVNRSAHVTSILLNFLESIGGKPVNAVRIADLCVPDRQYLMLRLAGLLYGEQMWLNASCRNCESLFDVEVHRSDLPVKEAGENFPLMTLHIEEWTVNFRIPTGADQELIFEKSESEAIEQLLLTCVHSVNGKQPDREFIQKLSEDNIKAIDSAMDDMAPAVCSQLLLTCPECGQEQYTELDHYALTGINLHSFYDEVHTLASHYHWSEDVILNLPQARRRLYLDMINRSTGMSAQV